MCAKRVSRDPRCQRKNAKKPVHAPNMKIYIYDSNSEKQYFELHLVYLICHLMAVGRHDLERTGDSLRNIKVA